MRFPACFVLCFGLVAASLADWQSTRHGEPALGYMAADSSGQRMIVGMSHAAGFWLTHDGGQTWEQINDRLNDYPVNRLTPRFEFTAQGAAGDTLIINTYPSNNGETTSHEYHSFDGGETWDTFTFDIGDIWPDSLAGWSGFGDPTFIQGDLVYYSRQEGFCISEDEGDSWQWISVNAYEVGLEGALFSHTQPDTILLFGAWGTEPGSGGEVIGGVIASHDGGHNWHVMVRMGELLPGGDGSIVEVERGSESNLYALTLWSTGAAYEPLLRSEDAGETWSWVEATGFPTATRLKHMLAVPEVPGRLFVGGSFEGGVWRSDDHGETWVRAQQGLPEEPAVMRSVYRNPYSGHLYVLLNYQGIYRSTDFGESWHQVPSPPVGASKEGWFQGLNVGESGVLHGGGIHFVGKQRLLFYSLAEEPTFHPAPYFSSSAEHEVNCYNVANDPAGIFLSRNRMHYQTLEKDHAIIRSYDGGSAWEEVPTTIPSMQEVVHLTHDDQSVLVGTTNRESLVHSVDGGETWGVRPTPFHFGYFIDVVGSDILLLSNDDPDDLYRSGDVGESWERLFFPDLYSLHTAGYTSHLGLNDTLYVRARESIWALPPDGDWEERGEMFAIYNNVMEVSWTVVESVTDTFIVAVNDLSHNMSISYDMGWTWEEQEIELPGYQGEVGIDVAYDRWRDRLWIDTGMGLAYLDNPTNAVGEDAWTFTPAQYALLDSYPNPFNGQATVRYSLTRPADRARLTVHDILGRQVMVLHDGPALTGTHATSLDASTLASGTYLLTLHAGPETVTRRITVVK